MHIAYALIPAGATGILINNSGLTYFGQTWQELADMDDTYAVAFAFATVINGKSSVWSTGTHSPRQAELEINKSAERAMMRMKW